MRYCGRSFSPSEIDWIRQCMQEHPGIHRKELSVRFCKHFEWFKPDGGLKEMSCRVAMLKMERDGLIRLPARQGQHHPKRRRSPRSLRGEPQAEIRKKAGELALRFEPVTERSTRLWNELIDRYHYLGFTPLAGAQLRYFIESQYGTVALMSFSAAAWKTAPRDHYIGWDCVTRRRNLPLVVNQSRFLLLPWVHARNLASRLLGMATRRLADDWQSRYNYRPVLVESFVRKDRFSGTSYKAANWTCVGETQGRGKLDRERRRALPVKTIWLYPLTKDFRERLKGALP
jgi:hypothetical protein